MSFLHREREFIYKIILFYFHCNFKVKVTATGRNLRGETRRGDSITPRRRGILRTPWVQINIRLCAKMWDYISFLHLYSSA